MLVCFFFHNCTHYFWGDRGIIDLLKVNYTQSIRFLTQLTPCILLLQTLKLIRMSCPYIQFYIHHHKVPLPEINFLKLGKKGMILIYFNSKNNNNLLVSPLYSKLPKKYSDLIRFSRHYLHEWHSFNIYGSSANVAHITEKMQCDHFFSGNGFR